VTFGVLALIVLAGLAGPALAVARPALVSLVVGELLAGVVIGRSGLRWLNPDQPTVAFLGEVGFAMLMFTAGLHVPLRQTGLTGGLRRGAVAAVIAAGLAVPAGLAAAAVVGGGHAGIYALLLASGSAAILFPVLEERRLLDDHRALTLMAQVALADIAAIVALPLVLQPGKAGRAALGGLLVAVCVLALLGVAHVVQGQGWVRRVRRLSKRRGWALDLRLSLLILFGLAWIAQRSGTSVLIASFGVGLMVAALGGPKRLFRQVAGIGSGFFVPLFFVVLGSRIDLRALGRHPSLIGLALMLVAANVIVHVLAARLTGQPTASGLAATAQLGVPAAVVTLGLQLHVLQSGQGAAIVAAALVTLGLCSWGGARLEATRKPPGEQPPVGAERPASNLVPSLGRPQRT
jgi:Kef-type K+ transport system membrane component KefB